MYGLPVSQVFRPDLLVSLLIQLLPSSTMTLLFTWMFQPSILTHFLDVFLPVAFIPHFFQVPTPMTTLWTLESLVWVSSLEEYLETFPL